MQTHSKIFNDKPRRDEFPGFLSTFFVVSLRRAKSYRIRVEGVPDNARGFPFTFAREGADESSANGLSDSPKEERVHHPFDMVSIIYLLLDPDISLLREKKIYEYAELGNDK